MSQNPMQDGVEKYRSEKQADDIDLIAVVRNILVNAGLALKLPMGYDNDKFIIEAAGKTSDVQRFLLNRYWYNQLMLSGQPCRDERYSLIPNGRIEDWIELFSTKIIPFVLSNDLPVPVE